ncbi:MAG: alkaline phosphatase family protein, partial [Mucilaginibacter sp.]
MKPNFLYFKKSTLTFVSCAFLLSLAISSCKKDKTNGTTGINKVNHVVVIYLENHSFDNLYGQFAGANGLSNATTSNTTQVDA